MNDPVGCQLGVVLLGAVLVRMERGHLELQTGYVGGNAKWA